MVKYDKTALEKLLKIDENDMTTTKDLYTALGLSDAHYARWVETNLLKNELFDENIDYFDLSENPLSIDVSRDEDPETIENWSLHHDGENPNLSEFHGTEDKGGRPSKNYWITSEVAKHLCLKTDSPLALQIYKYFIDSEKAMKLLVKQVPKLLDEIEKIKAQVSDDNLHLIFKQELARNELPKNELTEWQLEVCSKLKEYVETKIKTGRPIGYWDNFTIEKAIDIIKDRMKSEHHIIYQEYLERYIRRYPDRYPYELNVIEEFEATCETFTEELDYLMSL